MPAGISLFSGADCGAPVALGTIGKSFRANRFGTFSWFVSVTDSRFTVSSSTYVTTVKAVLTVDAGQEPLRVGDCNHLEVAAQADGALARANGDVNLDATFQQASAFLPNCGATKFTRDQAVTWVGVRPTAPGLLSVWVAGPGLDAGVATFSACSGAGGPCTGSAHCGQGSCVNTMCNQGGSSEVRSPISQERLASGPGSPPRMRSGLTGTAPFRARRAIPRA